jgi:DNA-binding response OmpR family regulator
MKHILEREGFEVFSATNPSSIHSYLFTYDVDLLITDVQMPDIPGTKVCQLIRECLPQLKIILFSNLPERDLEKLARQSKATTSMSKQKTPTEWLRVINEVCNEH